MESVRKGQAHASEGLSGCGNGHMLKECGGQRNGAKDSGSAARSHTLAMENPRPDKEELSRPQSAEEQGWAGPVFLSG